MLIPTSPSFHDDDDFDVEDDDDKREAGVFHSEDADERPADSVN